MHPPFYIPVDPRAKPDPVPHDVRTIIKPYRLVGAPFDVPQAHATLASLAAQRDWTQDPRFVPAPKGPGLRVRLGRALIRAGRALAGEPAVERQAGRG